jgi:hypothetical protein
MKILHHVHLQEYLEYPNSHISHDLLHTHYVRRGVFNELTEERYDISEKVPAERKTAAGRSTGSRMEPSGGRRLREEVQSVQLLSLESENAKLKSDLADI